MIGSLQGQISLNLQRSQRSVGALARTLHAVSPLATLDRGYAILIDDTRSIRSVRDVHSHSQLQARLSDGELSLLVTAITENSSRHVPPSD